MTPTKKALVALAVLLAMLGLWLLWKRRGAASTVASQLSHMNADRTVGNMMLQPTLTYPNPVSKWQAIAPEGVPHSPGPVPLDNPALRVFGAVSLRRL
jgi:hypothetical protein